MLTRIIEKVAQGQVHLYSFQERRRSGGAAGRRAHRLRMSTTRARASASGRAATQRPLCAFSPKRLPAGAEGHRDQSWSDMPTCVEPGLDIPQYQQPRTVWLPGKVTPDQVGVLCRPDEEGAGDAGVEGIHRAKLADRYLPGRRGFRQVHEARTSSASARSARKRAGSCRSEPAELR